MQYPVRFLSYAESAAIFAYLFSGGAIHVYKRGARALPPSYRDDSPRPPRIYCLNTPESEYRLYPNA